MASTLPRVYVIITNISKRGNWGMLLRSATAMGIRDFFVVGCPKLKTFGNMNTLQFCRFHYWDTLRELKAWLVEHDVEVVGIEIDSQAELVQNACLNKNRVAFMLGNEGTGMSIKQREIVDRFVIVPQFGGTTASLNVTMAGTIVFHYWSIGNNDCTLNFSGEKYAVSSALETPDLCLSQQKVRLESALDTGVNGLLECFM